MLSRLKSFFTILFLLSGGIVFSQVNADFIFDKSEGCGSLAVNFIDQSTSQSGAIVSWKWNLGGTISTKQNPGTIFTNPGQYTICLTVTTSSGVTASLCKDQVIKIYQDPVAAFIVDKKIGCNPVEVDFEDMSFSANGKIVSWTWDIGGSANVITTTDSLLPITTTYSSAGNYTSTLSVTDEKGCKNIITKPNLVEVVDNPKVTIDYTFLSSCDLPWDVQFGNLDADSEAQYSWDFGNGQTFSGQNPPIVTYTSSQKYSIQVIVAKGPCIDTTYLSNLINTDRITDYFVQSESLCNDQLIQFRDTSNYLADSLVWDFGDGTFSRELHPKHTYADPGCYTIKLTKYIGTCVQFIEKPCITIADKPDVTFTIDNGFSCIIPTKVNLNANANEMGVFEWRFIGGKIDTLFKEKSREVVIEQFGKYSAALTFIAENGCIVSFDSINIDIAKFEASLPFLGPKGCAPYDVMLTDSIVSNTPVTGWLWDIGSPSIFTSTDRSPLFMVTDTGRWDLRLIVENAYGCKDTILRNDYIRAGSKPIIEFVADPLAGCLSVPRQFTSLCSANTDFWVWSQNGTFFSFEENPEYIFPDFGVFDVTLTAFHNGCGNTLTKEDFITVYKPKSAFKVDYRCDDPYTIDITNQSVGADSLYWVVNVSSTKTDTIRDSLLNSYTFPERGLYFLTHYAKSFETGCEHSTTDSIFIVDLAASYTLDTIRGCAPLSVAVSSIVKDAVSTEFLSGQYTISDPKDQNPTVIFTEGGILKGPILVATDRHGCTDTFQTNVPVQVSKISTRIDGPDVVCIPNTEQFLDASIAGLGILEERRWYFSYSDQVSDSIEPTFDLPVQGSYFATLYLRDSWGCVDSIRKDVLAVPLIPAFSSDTLSCTSREIRFRIDNDATFLNAFVWEFGDGTTSTEKNPLHKFSQEGKYDICVEMFDSRGCSKKICEEDIVRILNPIANFSGDPISAPCPPLLSNFQNQSQYCNSYSWDFGDNSGISYTKAPSHVYTKPGNFTVTLYAEMMPGCVDTLIKPAYVQLLGPTAAIDFNIKGNCLPLEVELSGVADQLYAFTWDYGDGKINEVPTLIKSHTTNYFYDKPGSFVPKLLVSDDAGCSRIFSLDPIIVNNIEPSFRIDTSSFCGLPITIDVENSTISSGDYLDFAWKLSGSSSYFSTEINPIFTINDYGKFDIQMIASTLNCIDTLFKDAFVEIAPIPVPSFQTNDVKFCENSPIFIINNSTISSGSIAQWKWDTGQGNILTGQQPVLNFKENGSYTVKLTTISDKGCVDSIAQTFSILPNTFITLSEDKTICLGDSTNIFAEIISTLPDYSFAWKNDQTIACTTCQLVNVKPAVTTTYFFETSSTNGCSNQDSVLVTVIPIAGPLLVLSADTVVCEGGSIDIKVLNYNPNYIYEWDPNDAGLDCYTGCDITNAKPNTDTYYSIIVRNTYGCVKEDSILVTVERNIPDFLIPGKTICEGDSTTIEVTGVVSPVWSDDATISCTQCFAPVVAPLLPQFYFVQAKSIHGCAYRDSVFVAIIPSSSIDAGTDHTICKGEIWELTGSAIGDVIWTSKNEKITNEHTLFASIKPDRSDTYYLQSMVGECILQDSVQIKVIEKTDVKAIGDTICPKEVAVAHADGNSEHYTWYDGKKNIGSGATLELIPDQTTSLLVVGSKGLCETDSAFVNILVYPEIIYGINADSYEVYLNSKVNVEADYDHSGNYIYEWTPSTGLSCRDCPEPSVSDIGNSIQYTVKVSDDNGCHLEDNVFVRFINDCNKIGFYIPNIFSPNNDGQNDGFRVYSEKEDEFVAISIYDRWGNKVFTSAKIDELWDGIYQGKELSPGVYTFIITARCQKSNETYNFTGDITIFR